MTIVMINPIIELTTTAIIPAIKLLVSPSGLTKPGNSKIPNHDIVYSLNPTKPRYAPPNPLAIQLMINGVFNGSVIP